MVQISEHCHTTITHPLVDTYRPKQRSSYRKNYTKTVVAAAEWHTRRQNHIYRTTPRGNPPLFPSDHQVEYHLHYSSPQNLRKSGDLWGFSTQDNQPVRSFDDPSCLICPIGHIGWSQVDIATAILSCWGRSRHLPYPRPDLVEFQEQTEAIHAFLSRSEVVKQLEAKRKRTDPGLSLSRNKRPLEFTNGHLQLECLRGRWLVRDWKDQETNQYSWIAPEENFLSALIRPPGQGPSYNGNEVVCLGTRADRMDRPAKHEAFNAFKKPPENPQAQIPTRPDWPQENTATMVFYLQQKKWRTPFLWRLRSINTQWKITIEALVWGGAGSELLQPGRLCRLD